MKEKKNLFENISACTLVNAKSFEAGLLLLTKTKTIKEHFYYKIKYKKKN